MARSKPSARDALKKLREQTQFELMDLQHELGITFIVVTALASGLTFGCVLRTSSTKATSGYGGNEVSELLGALTKALEE